MKDRGMDERGFPAASKQDFYLRLIFPILGISFILAQLIILFTGTSVAGEPTDSPWLTVFRFYSQWIHTLGHLPAACVDQTGVNSLQKAQCSLFWNGLYWKSFFATAPVLTGILLFKLAQTRFDRFYENASASVSSGRPILVGKVLRSAQTRSNWFSWFYGLKTTRVQLPNQSTALVYVSPGLPTPLPGESLALFPAIPHQNEGPYLGVFHGPHLMVVRGS